MGNKFPEIIEMSKVKYPPGTHLVAKHNADFRYVVRQVSSWHGYDDVVWTEEGVTIRMNPQYGLSKVDSEKAHIFCSQDSIDRDYFVEKTLAPSLGSNHGRP
jgi:hypothetical protein